VALYSGQPADTLGNIISCCIFEDGSS